MATAAFIGNESLWNRGHPDGHPLRPERLQDTWDLLHAYGAFDAPNTEVLAPRYPHDDDLLTLHTREYLNVVRQLSRGIAQHNASQFGFGDDDNPIFEGMFESESLKVGAALVGADLIIKGRVDRVFSYGGGLHHAYADHASGFCVFGDGAIAIKRLLDHDLRVAYIDIDAHHGDGVQAAFYDEPDVLTISLHETGDYLFPGSGFIEERGVGNGLGACINVPLAPYSEDESVLWVFDQIVPDAIERFQPDVVVAQFGVDAHWQDPLTHLALTMHGLDSLFQRITALSLRLLAVGGGGYNRSVVPRAWTLAWAAMSGQIFPEELPSEMAKRLETPRLHDHEPAPINTNECEWARQENERTVAEVLALQSR